MSTPTGESQTTTTRGGYIGPYPLGASHEIEFHGRNTVLASLGASAAATILFLGIQHDSPTGPTFEFSGTTENSTIQTTRHSQRGIETTFTSQPGEATVVPLVPRTETASSGIVGLGRMPDVLSFDLDSTPESQIVLNKEALDGLLQRTTEQLQDGWSVSRITVTGLASDEARIRGEGAGIGATDPENATLATQYGNFIQKALFERAQELGVALPEGVVIDESHEVVLDRVDRATMEKLRAENGFASNLELVNTYKFDPESLSQETRDALADMLDNNRGAFVEITYAKTTGGTEATTPQSTESTWTKTERCVIDVRVEGTTVVTSEPYDFELPVVPLLVPVGKIRRKGKLIAADELGDLPEPVAPPSPRELRRQAKRAAAREKRLTKFYEGNPMPGEATDAYLARTAEWRAAQASRQTRNRWLGRLCAGTIVAAAVVLPRVDAGYCPDPENYAAQKYEFGKGWLGFVPDTLHVGLGIPFTDIESDKIEFRLNPSCDDGTTPANPGTPAPTSPDCDTRTTYYLDGKPNGTRTETHYPGAVTVTQE